MAITQSLHVGTSNNNIGNITKLVSVSKHNERLFLDEKKYNRDLIFSFTNGTIYENVRKIYDVNLKPYVDDYNAKQKRDDRKVDDYLKFVSNKANQNIACEIILQYGDMDFWKDIDFKNDKMIKAKVIDIYEKQLECFLDTSNTLVKDLGGRFDLASAVLHLDESSPHMHIIGVPLMPSKRHVKLQPNKSLFFSTQRLEKLHDTMRDNANEIFEKEFKISVIKSDEEPRPYVEINEYKRQKDLAREYKNRVNGLRYELEKLNDEIENLKIEKDLIERKNMEYQYLQNSLKEKIANLENNLDIVAKSYKHTKNNLEELKLNFKEYTENWKNANMFSKIIMVLSKSDPDFQYILKNSKNVEDALDFYIDKFDKDMTTQAFNIIETLDLGSYRFNEEFKEILDDKRISEPVKHRLCNMLEIDRDKFLDNFEKMEKNKKMEKERGGMGLSR